LYSRARSGKRLFALLAAIAGLGQSRDHGSDKTRLQGIAGLSHVNRRGPPLSGSPNVERGKTCLRANTR